MTQKRAMILIDGDNLSGMERILGVRIDLAKLRDMLLEGREEYDTTMFLSLPAKGDATPFAGRIGVLRSKGIRVVAMRRSIKMDADGKEYQVGYPDGLLYTHATSQFEHFDVLILVSGDGGFQYLLEFLSKKMGKRVEICIVPKMTSWDLQNTAHRVWNLDWQEMLNRVKLDSRDAGANGETSITPAPTE